MLDRVTVSVIQHRLVAITQEMGEAMLRTAYSQILNSSRDFSTAICDATGRVIAQAEHVPVHVGALPWAVRSVRGFFKENIRPGDLYLLNDPYHGGNHLPDVTALLPVFANDQLLFWSINRAHHSDIGGSTHGGYNPTATEIWQEGIRITPLKLYDRGEARDDVMHLVATNVRHSQDFLGDLRASIGSARVGERRLLSLAGQYGIETLTHSIGEILNSTEHQARACIQRWKDGIYHGDAIQDDDGRGTVDVCIRATVTKSRDRLVVDLTESDPQVPGFINSPLPNTMAAINMAIAFLIDADIPKNDGTFRPVAVKLREGTVVHPFAPAPVTLSTSGCGQEICEAIVKALAPACPDRVFAGWPRRFRVAIRGTDPRTKHPFIWHLFHARSGGGASAAGDGWPTAGEGAQVGGVKAPSVEVTEVRFPLFLERHEFRPNSGGDGQFRGGVGAVLKMRIETSEQAIANTAGDGVRHAAYGLFRGKEGLPHDYRLMSRGRSRVLETNRVGIPVLPGDVFVIRSAGGGGYGPPTERSPDVRRTDRRNGFVTDSRVEGARPRRAAAFQSRRRRRRSRPA